MGNKSFDGLEGIDPGRIKKESKSYVYLLAGIAGILLCIFFIYGIKLSIVVIKAALILLKNYWIWIIVVIVILIILKKILSKKHVEVHREYPGY